MRWTILALCLGSLESACLPKKAGIKRRVEIDGAEYSIPIETNGWPSRSVISWVARIILEERVGYSVTFNNINRPAIASTLDSLSGCPVGKPSCNISTRTAVPESFVNLEAWSSSQPSDPVDRKFVDSLGASGVIGRTGWYINSDFAEQQWTQRSVILDDYRAFTKPQSAGKAYTAQAAGVVEEWFEGAYTNTSINYAGASSVSETTKYENGAQYSCTTDEWCSDGWYNPSQCSGAVSFCATMFGNQWDSDRTVLTNKLSTLKGNFTRVQLPECVPISSSATPTAAAAAAARCDYPQVVLQKYAWEGLHTHASPAHHVLQRLSLTNADMRDMLAKVPLASITTGAGAEAGAAAGSVEYTAACDWLKANEPRWARWLPDPSADACGPGHYHYTVHACGSEPGSSGSRHVSFHWSRPSAADASVPEDCAPSSSSLPASTYVKCSYVQASIPAHQRLLALAGTVCVMCAAAALFVVIAYNHKVLHKSQPWLLLVNAMGCALVLCPMFFLAGKWDAFKCNGAMAFDGIGITLIVSGYIVKAWHYMLLSLGKHGTSAATGQPGQGIRRLTPLRLPRLPGSNRVANAGGGSSQQSTAQYLASSSKQVHCGPRRSSALRVHNKIRGLMPDGAPPPPAISSTGSPKPSRRASLMHQLQAVVTTGGRIVEYSGQDDRRALRRHMKQIMIFVSVEVLLVALRLAIAPRSVRVVTATGSFGPYEEQVCATAAGAQSSEQSLSVLYWLYKLLLTLLAFYATYHAQKVGIMQGSASPTPLLLLLLGWALFTVSYHYFGIHTAEHDYVVNGVAKICCVTLMCVTTYFPLVKAYLLGSGKRVHVLSHSYLIAYEQLKLMKPIGGGSFSDVLKGRYKQTQVAVKRLRGDISETQMRAFGKEVVVMAELHHPNVVMMMGFCVKPPLLIMEYLGRGSLYNLLHASNTQLEWTMVLKILSDTACGMSYLHAHQPPLIHADLKTPNILVDIYWRCKIADLGLAKLKEDTRLGSMTGGKVGSACAQVGSLLWCAPELFTNKRVTTRSDTYAFGIIMYECIYRRVPFAEISPMAVPFKVVDGARPSCPDKPPQNTDTLGPLYTQLKALMEACWNHEPSRRPPFEHVLAQLEWMAEDYTGLENWEGAVIFPVTDERMSSSEDQSMVASISSAVRQGYTLMESDLELGFKIGEGNYGTVLEGMYLGTKVAVKQLFVDGMGASVLKEFHKEVDLMKECNHPNLVALLGAVESNPKLLLVTELLERGSLWDMYHAAAKNKHFHSLKEHMAFGVKLALDVAKGMVHLHQKGIIHRDLKSQNIWLSEDYNAKVGDFGMSRIASHHTMTMVGSPLWCAPEILKSMNYTYSADVYSYSIILYEAFHWMEPYIKMSVMEIMIAVTEHHERPEIEMSVPEQMCTLICDCWQPDASKRPTFEQIATRIQIFVNENPQLFAEKRSDRKRISGRGSSRRNGNGSGTGNGEEPASPRTPGLVDQSAHHQPSEGY